jgi:hypothetical protein
MNTVTEAVRAKRSTGAIVITALVAALLGLGVALAALRIGLAVQPGPDLGGVADLIYPGLAVTTAADPDSVDRPAWSAFMAAEDGPADPEIAPRDQPAAAASLIAPTRARLEAAGWTTRDGQPDSLAFSAVQGGTRLDFYAFDSDAFTVVRRHPTTSTIAVAAVAGPAAAVLGWWLCACGIRGMRRIGPGARTAVRETAVVGLVLTLPALAQTALILSGRTTADFHPPQGIELLVEYARWPAALGLLLLLAAVIGLVAAGTGRDQPSG